MAISSIQKQNTIYRKQEYQKENSISKEQTKQTVQNTKQNEAENIKENVTEKKDIFLPQQQKENKTLPTQGQNKQKKSNVDYQATEDLIKLMNAKSTSEVRSIIARIKGEMAQTKSSGGEEEQIKKAVAKMKKVIKKAQSKEKALIAENKMELQMKMKQKNEAEEAEEIGTELQAKKRKRMSKEINDVLNSSNDIATGSSENASFMDIGGDLSMTMPEIGNIDISI
ncbi:hypothetical protein [Clostridium sp. MD294]|uniref:hypothetical protein n=1 Tax=Clostridium sp. MD294 TaxID=97138 RepID=UPI0002C98F59|nr:hypothetical protein [Clostridium sp. MD294]NDO46470.1 hypothetical protein [Clostridium sp. MD294]USF29100.1 hypothetical protein C820_000483 [Clostridium sp. MD294]